MIGPNVLFAQSIRDSLAQKTTQPTNSLDSIQFYLKNSLDSIGNLPHRFTHLADSLRPNLSKYNRTLDSIKGKLTHRIDSLKRLNLHTAQYSHLLDSIGRAGPVKDIRQAEAKLLALQNKVNEPVTKFNGKVNKLENKINQKLSLLNKEAGVGANLPGDASLPTGAAGIPLGQASLPNLRVPGINPGVLPNTNLNLPSGSLPNVTNPLSGITGLENNNLAGNLGKETSELKNLTSAPQRELSQLKNAGELGQASKELGQVTQITQQAKGYKKDLKNLSKGNLDSVNQVRSLEKKAMQMGERKELQGELKQVDQYKGMLAKGNDPMAVKNLAKEQAVNHFAGKEKELQNAMSQVSMYKQKYASLSSIKDIPKHARNTMHGKPLIDRIVPGINLQVQKKGTVLIDFNPQAGYRFNDRLTIGAGWNERIGFYHYTHLIHKDRIFGPRTFAQFSFRKGFALRGEVETMNTFVPPLITGSTAVDHTNRQWVWGVFGGIKKEYKISKTIRGNIQVMYNFHDRFLKTSPYADRLNVRMGFEFLMKKRIKKELK
jgi:hypothetical protein